MLIQHGIDVINIPRIEKLYQRFNEKFISRVFTVQEQEYCLNKSYNFTDKYTYASLAKRFAAKEAFAKAIGDGIGFINFRDIEIINNEKGSPHIVLNNKLVQYFMKKKWKNANISLSLSDDYPIAIASVIITYTM